MQRASTWSAPGRVNLIGDHTDYNGGLALPIAVDLRTVVTLTARHDDLVTVRSRQHPGDVEVPLDGVGPGVPAGWAGYAAGVLAVLRARGHDVGGADIVIDGGVPQGAGLSSSAALECAVAGAAYDVFGLDLTPDVLAEVAREAENDVVGVPCGEMDQRTAMLARADHALLLDFGTGATTQVPVPGGATLLVIDTRVRHALVDGQYAARRRRCEEAARRLGLRHLSELTPADLGGALERLADDSLAAVTRHVVTENARVRRAVDALTAGDWQSFGGEMTASHASLRDDYAVSCPELDRAVESALDAGAYGARMTGGGFGGSAVAVVPPARHERVVESVEQSFAAAAATRPDARIVRASGGARREPG